MNKSKHMMEVVEYISNVEVSTETSPQKGNLTGIPRKIRDNCAEWHNLIQRWNQCNVKGLDCIQVIINLRLETEETARENASGRHEKLQQLCDILQEIYQKMMGIFDAMKQITSQLEQVISLHETQQSYQQSAHSDVDGTTNRVLFQTWPVNRFWKSSKALLEMYSQEISLKGNVLESIAHSVNKEELLFLMTIWVHEPCLHPKLTLQLEAMLTETKYR